MAGSVPFAVAQDGMRLAIRLIPKAASNRIVGLIEDGHGGWALKVAVTAPPVDGKANGALIKLLARQLGLKPRDVAVVQGLHDRAKVIAVSGDPAVLAGVLTEGLRPWLARD